MYFLSSVKVDTGLLFAPLKKIGMTFLIARVRGNIEEISRITYQLNYGEDNFYPLSWIGGHI